MRWRVGRAGLRAWAMGITMPMQCNGICHLWNLGPGVRGQVVDPLGGAGRVPRQSGQTPHGGEGAQEEDGRA